MNKWMISGIVLTGAGLGIMGALAFAQKVRADVSALQGDLPFSQNVLAHLAYKLDLTDSQKAQIHQIVESEKPVMAPILINLASERATLKEMGDQGTVDNDALVSEATETANTVAAAAVEVCRTKTEIINVLTPEQQEKAIALRDQFGSLSKERLARFAGAPDRISNFLAWKLNLTDDQQSQIASILNTSVPEISGDVQSLSAQWKTVQADTVTGQFNEAQVTADIDAMKPALIGLIVQGVDTKAQVAAVLTPDQRDEALQMREAFLERLQERRGA